MDANLAVLIDFENIAAGTEKEGLGRFDIEALMGRVKDKGRVLVARSYADWGRFARFKQSLLSQNVTMMELTSHGMQDKNRADIAMVVDTLEMAFTRDYIDTFVVVSGDSDFTPMVLKLRELNKRVIGCGTRSSTSRLLIQACDEFFFYDSIAKRPTAARAKVAEERAPAGTDRKEAFAAVVDALAGLQMESPDPPLASVVKNAILRKVPDFSESDLGYSSFARFLEAVAEAGRIKLLRDSKSGGYRVDSPDAPDRSEDVASEPHAPAGDQDRSGYDDPYMPEGAKRIAAALAAEGLDPLAAPTRKTLLEAFVDEVTERQRRRRRCNLRFVQEDVKKRLKKTHPEVPAASLRAVFDAVMRTGALLHKDGAPIRSATAPFTLDKTADELNDALTTLYLGVLVDTDFDTTDTGLLADLFLGDAARKREIEETLAWLNAPEEAGGEAPGSLPEEIDETDDNGVESQEIPEGVNLDDLLSESDAAPAAAEAPSAEAVVAPEAAEPQLVDDAVFLESDESLGTPDEEALEAAPVEGGGGEEPRKPRRKRVRKDDTLTN